MNQLKSWLVNRRDPDFMPYEKDFIDLRKKIPNIINCICHNYMICLILVLCLEPNTGFMIGISDRKLGDGFKASWGTSTYQLTGIKNSI